MWEALGRALQKAYVVYKFFVYECIVNILLWNPKAVDMYCYFDFRLVRRYMNE